MTCTVNSSSMNCIHCTHLFITFLLMKKMTLSLICECDVTCMKILAHTVNNKDVTIYKDVTVMLYLDDFCWWLLTDIGCRCFRDVKLARQETQYIQSLGDTRRWVKKYSQESCMKIWLLKWKDDDLEMWQGWGSLFHDLRSQKPNRCAEPECMEIVCYRYYCP